jgi:CHAT domain-containing protein/Tfp pilus assembly protein PilF
MIARALTLLVLLTAPAVAEEPLAEAQRVLVEANKLIEANRLSDAIAPLTRATELVGKLRGADSPNVAQMTSKLGELYYHTGQLDRAEASFQRALAIPDYADSVPAQLGNLGMVYVSMGLYDRAEAAYTRALPQAEKVLGAGHLSVAILCAGLGNTYQAEGALAKAEPLYRRALAIHEQLFGKEHVNTAPPCNNLAQLELLMGRYDEAEALFRRALAIQEKLGPASRDIAAVTLNNLASLYAITGAYDRARPLLARAFKDTADTLDARHPQLGLMRSTEAFLDGAEGHPERAVEPLTAAAINAEQLLAATRLASSEARLSAYLSSVAWQEQMAWSLLLDKIGDPGLQKIALAIALLRKGRSVDQAQDLQRAALRGLGPADEERFEELKALRAQIAQAANGRRDPGTSANAIALERKADAIEEELARRSAPLRAARLLPGPKEIVAQVAAALPRDAVLIELLAFRRLNFRPKQPREGELRYLALVLAPDGTVGAADLGPGAAIDAEAGRQLAALTQPGADPMPSASALYRLVIAPIEPLLGARRNLVIAPDGILSLVPFAALHDGKGWLLDRYTLTSLSSGRDLLRPDGTAPARDVTILAAPDFAAPSKARARFDAAAPLPGTREEALALQRLYPKARMYLGAAATAGTLLGLRAPGILHVATHGLFAGAASSPGTSRGVSLPSPAPAAPGGNPLTRSSLVLAGGELVSALELAGMDLSGTQLVVLSACDTGRGDVRLGQGVYGLRRALLVAGAETLVTSLWRVDDAATRDLMIRYYTALRAGAGRAAAMRTAALAVRAQHPHPYYWAPFLVIGRPDPLRVR